MRMWVYFQKKGTILDRYEWHNHYRNQTKEEFSFIIYLSDTDLGTLFKVDDSIIKLKPRKNLNVNTTLISNHQLKLLYF